MKIISVLVFCALAHASTVYTYTGDPFTRCQGSYTNVCGTPAVTISFEISGPIQDNLPYQNISDVIVFSFSDSMGLTINQANDPSTQIFSMSTNSVGIPDQWDFGVALINGLYTSIASTNVPDYTVDAALVDDGYNQLQYGNNQNDPGTWSVVDPPSISSVPEPASFAFVGIGLLAFGVVRFRRS